MSKQVVLITGALTGIGRATALAFAHEGAQIVVSGRKEDAGHALVKELRAIGAEAQFVQADVRREAEVKALVDKTVGYFGRLDVAVNNAGTEGTPGPLIEQTAETYNAVFETNVLGVVFSLKHQLQAMLKQGSGSIINISSTLGKVASPGASIYTASKHAVEGLTKAAALEVASSKIRVNNVAPGPTDTAMLSRFAGNDENKTAFLSTVPLQRMARPEEIAQTVLFLASDKAPFITGQTFGVDGGLLA